MLSSLELSSEEESSELESESESESDTGIVVLDLPPSIFSLVRSSIRYRGLRLSSSALIPDSTSSPGKTCPDSEFVIIDSSFCDDTPSRTTNFGRNSFNPLSWPISLVRVALRTHFLTRFEFVGYCVLAFSKAPITTFSQF